MYNGHAWQKTQLGLSYWPNVTISWLMGGAEVKRDEISVKPNKATSKGPTESQLVEQAREQLNAVSQMYSWKMKSPFEFKTELQCARPAHILSSGHCSITTTVDLCVGNHFRRRWPP